MSTRRIVKLSAGEAVTVAVGVAGVVKGKYGEDVQLDGRTPAGEDVTVFVKRETAERQFTRIGLASLPESINRTLVVSKVAKNGKVYTNIDLAKTNGAPIVQQAAEPEKATPTVDERRDERLTALFTMYDICFAHALTIAKRAHEKYQTEYNLASVGSIAATLFINASERGIR